ncbi:hypothetical protein [Microvirga sp. 2TAF3]|uniref:hypothetical protein n=1 Tax=Microvirga sp. 2TAF3 TaxID=3233014 RepID=UPI003F9549AC
MDTSAHLGQDPVAEQVASELQTLLAMGHPHNNFLQNWGELGFPVCIVAPIGRI